MRLRRPLNLRVPMVTTGANVYPSFYLPLNDLGNGAVNTTPFIALGSATANFTRATAGWTRLSSGLWVSVNSGVARSYYDSNGVMLGYLAEGQRTNEALYDRDIGNLSGAWVCTDCTPALNAVGIDGQANACTKLTATGANATALQTIASAANVARTFAPFIKRGTGTGNIYITIDNGATWTDVTSQISSGIFVRPERTQTLANPIIGFKIATSGDSIIIDVAGEEAGAFASTPIVTANLPVQRNADVLTYASAGNISGTQGSAYLEVTTNTLATAADSTQLSTGTSAPITFTASTGKFSFFESGGSPASVAYGGVNTMPITSAVKVASIWGGGIKGGVVNGSAISTAAFSSFTPTSIQIGIYNSSNQNNFGTIRNVRIYPTALPAARLQAMTA